MGGVHLSPLLFGFVFIHKRFQKLPTPTTPLSPRTLLTVRQIHVIRHTRGIHVLAVAIRASILWVSILWVLGYWGISLHKTDSDTPLHTTPTYLTAYDTHVRLWYE